MTNEPRTTQGVGSGRTRSSGRAGRSTRQRGTDAQRERGPARTRVEPARRSRCKNPSPKRQRGTQRNVPRTLHLLRELLNDLRPATDAIAADRKRTTPPATLGPIERHIEHCPDCETPLVLGEDYHCGEPYLQLVGGVDRLAQHVSGQCPFCHRRMDMTLIGRPVAPAVRWANRPQPETRNQKTNA